MLLLGLDTGGTYTDAVLFDDARGTVVCAGKSLTTKHDLIVGLRGAIEAVLSGERREIGLVALSTTLATNAIVERQGSPICLLLLGYDRKALDRAGLRRALGDDPVVFIAGGHDAAGDEQSPLDLDALESAIRGHAPGIAAFAVSGFFSVRNAAHEIAARDLIRRLTGLPVTCGHELTSRLDAPRRALTAALNARLVPQLQQLIRAVEALMREKAIDAPLMVVKGDGSLVAADVALARPVETILSGPAASVVGARHLSGAGNVMVADMGGTTTDIALLQDGLPVLDREGAVVAGWKTMVEAVAVHTYGLGGDSEVHRHGSELAIGPRRLLPLSLLAHQYPQAIEVLAAQLAAERAVPGAGRFALRNRALDAGRTSLTAAQARIWDELAGGPLPVTQVAAGYAAARALDRLVDRGLVAISGMTPTDATHLTGQQGSWSVEAARLGAELWIREDLAAARPSDADTATFARRIIETVVMQSSRAVLAAALAVDSGIEMVDDDRLGRRLIDQAVGPSQQKGLLGVALSLRRPLVAIGAPVTAYYPAVAERLQTQLIVPPFSNVCNAVGAVAGGVAQSVTALVTAPVEGIFRVHLPAGNRDFGSLEAAAEYAVEMVTALVSERARQAGADEIEIHQRRFDKIHRDDSGLALFIESRIEVSAFGRPRLANR